MFNPGNSIDTHKEAHRSSDVDAERSSLHHTLGPGPNQAAPGNHKHDGSYSSVEHDHDGSYSPVGHTHPKEFTDTIPAPAETSTNGTPSPTTGDETRDALLGNYQFTAQAGVLYRVILDGLQMNSNVANDRYSVNIRDGGNSTPNTSSTLVAQGFTVVPGTGVAGRVTMSISGVFEFTPGVHTLSAFTMRQSGTGQGTPVGKRQLYVTRVP